MTLSELRDRVSTALREFAWAEWTQMGVLGTGRPRSAWSADPEAHLLFALQVGRDDPRLFDEILDWWATNARLISVQRFRNMFGSEEDRRLGEAALAWVSRHSRHGRAMRTRPTARHEAGESLFYAQRPSSSEDETFAEFGFAKPPTRRSHKSSEPNPWEPINFAFLLRQGLGVGSRAEIVRFLVTAGAASPFGSSPLFTTLAIADAAAFAKRNIQETLNVLVDVGWVDQTTRGNEYLYAVETDRWRAFLRLDDVPRYRDWTNALHALRELHRWLHDAEAARYTDYMLGSEARLLVRAIEPSLRYAGVALSSKDATGASYWDDVFVDLVDRVLAWLASGASW